MTIRTAAVSSLLAIIIAICDSGINPAAADTVTDPVLEAKKHYNFAVQYKNSGSFDEAQRQYEKAIALCDTIYQFHFSYADLLGKIQQPEKARAEYLRALELNPRHFPTLTVLSENYRQAACYDSALVMYERMYAVEPERRELLASIAGYREYLGNAEGALEAYTELIAKGEAGYETIMKAAVLASREGDLSRARDFAVMALEVRAEDREALSLAANASMQIEDRDSAVLYLRRICEADTADVASHSQLAKLYRSQGDTGNLLWTLERQVRVDSMNVEAIGELAEILYTQGNIEEGIMHVRRGLIIDPKDGRMHILMGENYRRLNQNDKALAEYRIALKDPAWSSSAQRLIWQIERPESAAEKKEKDFFNRK